MKNILVAIDFSAYAQQVAMNTAEFAKLAQARLILFYAYNPTILTDTDGEKEEYVNSERCVQSQMDKLARKIYRKTKVSVTRLIKPGILQEEAFKVAERVKADVVIFCLKDTVNAIPQLPTSPVDQYSQQIPTLIVSDITNPNPEAVKPTLAELLNLPGFNSSPLLEAI